MKRLFTSLILVFVFINISSQTNSVERIRQVEFIKQFIDAYRQAYDKRDICFINDIFSEQALIITQTLQLQKYGETYKNRGKRYKIVIENKKGYVKRLREIFESASYLRLEITTPKKKEHSHMRGLYGVSFYQVWEGDGKNTYSGELHSKGCVLLIIDFTKNPNMPTIHVRTWQPESILKEESKFDLYDFKIIR